MSRVFIVQMAHRLDRRTNELVPVDVSSAAQYGTLVELLSPSAKPFWPNDEVVRELHEGLRTYTPDDHLLMIGNPCLIAMAAAVAANYSGGSLNLLQWHGKQKLYIPVRVDLQVETEDEAS